MSVFPFDGESSLTGASSSSFKLSKKRAGKQGTHLENVVAHIPAGPMTEHDVRYDAVYIVWVFTGATRSSQPIGTHYQVKDMQHGSWPKKNLLFRKSLHSNIR